MKHTFTNYTLSDQKQSKLFIFVLERKIIVSTFVQICTVFPNTEER
jgi:hypothetical protein